MTSEADSARRFQIETAGVRGAIVHLDRSWSEIAARADYPDGLRHCLGQFAAAGALFAANISFQGTVSVQLRGEHPIPLVFAECTATGRLRGLAQWQGLLPALLTPVDFGSDAVLAISIERGGSSPRYQGLVDLETPSVVAAFENYFRRSEQLPTALRLCVQGDHAAGMLVQQLPSAGGRALREQTLDFERIATLFATLSDDELLHLPAETVLRRLFVEDDIRLSPPTGLHFGCTCSRERVVNALKALGADDITASRDACGTIDVHCEFCNQHYGFSPTDLEQMFRQPIVAPGSDRIQ